MLASKRNGTLYTGVTSSLVSRIDQHKVHAVKGFSSRYKLNILVWAEAHETMLETINREKQIKKWKREWKLNLIEKDNPEWKDLSKQIA